MCGALSLSMADLPTHELVYLPRNQRTIGPPIQNLDRWKKYLCTRTPLTTCYSGCCGFAWAGSLSETGACCGPSGLRLVRSFCPPAQKW